MSTKIRTAAPQWPRKTLASALALALTNVVFVAPASAVCTPANITISTAEGLQAPQDCDAVTVTSSGSVTSQSNGESKAFSYSNLAGSLDNSGNISATYQNLDNHFLSAYGVKIDGHLSGNLNNSGTISANASNIDIGDAFGIQIGGNLSGSLTNSGTISAIAHGQGTNNIYGIDIAGSLSGSLINNGTISANAPGTASDPHWGSFRVTGISLGLNPADHSGALINNGTISATATNNNFGLITSARGIYGANFSGTFINNGTISTNTSGNSEVIETTGIRFKNLSGTLTNNGNISVTSSGTPAHLNQYSLGIDLETLSGTLNNSGTILSSASGNGGEGFSSIGIISSISGTLNNSGTISATTSDSARHATSMGANVGVTQSGNLNNSGIISATAAGSISTESYGLQASLSGSLINYGTILATAYSGNGDTISSDPIGLMSGCGMQSYGISVSPTLSGHLINNGTISATAYGDAPHIRPSGVGIYGALSGSLINNGTISATASTNDGYKCPGICETSHLTLNGNSIDLSSSDTANLSIQTNGLRVWETLSGTLVNTGTISATISGKAFAMSASGIWSGSISNEGTLTNSGTISATASGEASIIMEAAGVRVGTLNGTLTNSGSISASAPGGDAYSLYVVDGTGTINNQAGGVLTGSLNVGGTVAVNNAGNIVIPASSTAGSPSQIAGNYTQQAGGLLTFGATNTTNYGRLNVGGTATLMGSTLGIHPTPDNTLAVGDVLPGVISAGTLVTDGSVNVIALVGSPLFGFTGIVNGNNIDVAVTAKRTFAGVLESSSLGSTLDGLVRTYRGNGNMNPLIDKLYQLNSRAELDDAMQKLSPGLAGGMGQMARGFVQEATGLSGHGRRCSGGCLRVMCFMVIVRSGSSLMVRAPSRGVVQGWRVISPDLMV